MANYKIKDLQQAQTLNGAVALEIQDGHSMSTFATLDQIAEFMGANTPVILRVKAGKEGDFIPDMTGTEIADAYSRIVADPVHNIPVVHLDKMYRIPLGYNVSGTTILAHYSSETYVKPYDLILTADSLAFLRSGAGKDVRIADLATGKIVTLSGGYLSIQNGTPSSKISAIVGGDTAFQALCQQLVDTSSVVIINKVQNNTSSNVPVVATAIAEAIDSNYHLNLGYILGSTYVSLVIVERNGAFIPIRKEINLLDIPNALAGKADLDPATGFVKSSQIGEIVIDSGIFFTDIAEGTANKRIDVPRGYVALAVAVYNYNASALTNVIVQNWTDERTFIYGATVNNARAVYSVSAAGNKSVYNGKGITIDPTVQFLKVMATGNTTSGGMRVRVICKYLGV